MPAAQLLMHLSDLHFGAHDPAVCAAAQRLARRLGLSLAVVSGDLAQRATDEQFEQAARFLRGLRAPRLLVLPGNHDLPLYAWWMRWGRAYERFARQFGERREPVRSAGPFYVVGVDTTRPWRHERGSLSHRQVEQVAGLLGQAPPGAWRIVASHHPLAAQAAPGAAHRPARADAALLRWRAAGAQMLLSGHVHQPALVQALPGLWAAGAGTAVSLRLRHGSPNSLVVLAVEPDGARCAQRWDYDSGRQEFCCVQRRVLAAAGDVALGQRAGSPD